MAWALLLLSPVPSEMEITGLLTKEKPYVVDDPRSFTGALVDRFSWAGRRRTNSPTARRGACRVNYQSRLWSQSDLIPTAGLVA